MPTRRRTMPPAPKRTMPARKCRLTCAPPVVPELPACLLLEIAARTDAPTIFRCAATCKPLRREIQSLDFVRRVCQGPDAIIPSRTLFALGADDTFSLLHPVTAATAALETHLAPFMSRVAAAAGLLEAYEPQTSRNGLVVLSRRESKIDRRRRSSDLCVYDPMANTRAFLPFAPDIERGHLGAGLSCGGCVDPCALLTAADGIGCAFMLVAIDMARSLDCAPSARVRVQTLSSSDASGGAQWSPVKATHGHPFPWWCKSRWFCHQDAAVVVGGVVHWLMHAGTSLRGDDVGEYILTYDVNAGAVGSVDVPRDPQRPSPLNSPSMLAASADGRLSFVAVHAHLVMVVTVWVLSAARGGSWARRTQVDMMAEWGSMLRPWMEPRVELERFRVGGQRSGKVFLRFAGVRFVLDVGTGATCTTCFGGPMGVPYEVDLASRLTSMKSF